jgi:hypothetical protein
MMDELAAEVSCSVVLLTRRAHTVGLYAFSVVMRIDDT